MTRESVTSARAPGTPQSSTRSCRCSSDSPDGSRSTCLRRLPRHPGGGARAWTPTGNVPPLGALAAQETVSRSAVGMPPGAVGRPPGPAPCTGTARLRSACRARVPHPPLVTGRLPPIRPAPGAPPGPTGGWQPHRACRGSRPARRSRSAPAAPAGATSRAPRRWWIIGAAAAVVAILAGVSIFLLTRSNGPRKAPQTPTGLSAVRRRSNGHRQLERIAPARPDTRCAPAASGCTPAPTPRSPSEQSCRAPTSTPSPRAMSAAQRVRAEPGGFGDRDPPVAGRAVHRRRVPRPVAADPDRQGLRRRHLSISSDTEGAGVDHLIGCTDPNGVYFEVMHFPDARRRTRTCSGTGATPGHRAVDPDGVEQGQLYRSADDEATLPFVITTVQRPGSRETTWSTSTGRTTRRSS